MNINQNFFIHTYNITEACVVTSNNLGYQVLGSVNYLKCSISNRTLYNMKNTLTAFFTDTKTKTTFDKFYVSNALLQICFHQKRTKPKMYNNENTIVSRIQSVARVTGLYLVYSGKSFQAYLICVNSNKVERSVQKNCHIHLLLFTIIREGQLCLQ